MLRFSAEENKKILNVLEGNINHCWRGKLKKNKKNFVLKPKRTADMCSEKGKQNMARGRLPIIQVS